MSENRTERGPPALDPLPEPMPTLKPAFPLPLDKRARIAFIHRVGLANLDPEPQFDLVTKHVAKTTAFPASMLAMDRQTQ